MQNSLLYSYLYLHINVSLHCVDTTSIQCKKSIHTFFLILKKPKHSQYSFSEENDVILLMLRPQLLRDCPVLAYFLHQPFVYCPPRQHFTCLISTCPTGEGGGVSSCSLSFKETCTEMGRCEQGCF